MLDDSLQSGVLNVRDFGAVGDCVSDDYPAFEKALSAANDYDGGRGVALYIPAGCYDLSAAAASLPIEAPIRLQGENQGGLGEGTKAVILKGNQQIQMFKVQSTCAFSGIGFRNCSSAIVFGGARQDTISNVTIEFCRFEDAGLSTKAGAIVASRSSAPIEGLRVLNCSFHNCYSAVFLNTKAAADVWVCGNQLEQMGNTGIVLGSNEEEDAATNRNFLVSGNLLNGLRPIEAGASAFGILVRGQFAAILGNQLQEVRGNPGAPSSETAGETFGIYTKCRYSTVAGNVLTNAGQDAMINIKGALRSDPKEKTTPRGYAVIVQGNVLLGDSSFARGIRLFQGDAQACDNYVEGTANGIWLASRDLENVAVVNNAIRNLDAGSGQASGVLCAAGTGPVVIDGNRMISVSGASAAGILIQSFSSLKALAALTVTNNVIQDVEATGSGATSQGIAVTDDGGGAPIGSADLNCNLFSGVDAGIDFSNSVVNQLRIEGNRFLKVKNFAIASSWNQVPKASLRANYFEIPALAFQDGANLVKFPDGEATPSVAVNGEVIYATQNTKPTTVTNFLDGYPGAAIQLVFQDGNTIIDFSGPWLKGFGGREFKAQPGDFLSCFFDGTAWYCTPGRSSNGGQWPV